MTAIKTLILGASPNPDRESHRVASRMLEEGMNVVPVGNKKGEIAGVPILSGMPPIDNIHTVSLYLGAANQREYYDYILSLKPKRIIFNPGAENEEFEALAVRNGIEALPACTMTMLTIGNY